MNNLILRKATADDSEFAYATKKAAFRTYVEAVWGWDEDEQRRLHEKRFACQNFYVIQSLDFHVGILAVVREPDCMKVNQLFILPEYQGKGIGTKCMKQVLKEAKAIELPVRLRVLKTNHRAVEFYRKLDFQSTGENKTHILMEKAP